MNEASSHRTAASHCHDLRLNSVTAFRVSRLILKINIQIPLKLDESRDGAKKVTILGPLAM
jgi:hypothetical protein